MSASFTTAAALAGEMMEARDERRLIRHQKQLATLKLRIMDEFGFVPLSKTGPRPATSSCSNLSRSAMSAGPR